ncbi:MULTISPECIES: helix-turn-helix domain-containing protein [unclassified Nocardioides]|uniref:helix-turn-helix domain-containing protein n=1 Tax=unclassified Nocardioides TaxID=2615069 RepID=UPI0036245A2C
MTTVVVLTVDQRGSRTGPDLIPDALGALRDVPTRLPFERTVGDELQGVLDRGDAVAEALAILLRTDAWNIGVGFGSVEEPLPDHTRAGRGAAYLHARAAVTAAKAAPWHTRVVGTDEPVRGGGRALETTIWLWAAVLARRTSRGWEVADLADKQLSYAEIGEQLGISQSAVSQRAQSAGIVEARRAKELVAGITAHLLGTGEEHDG